MSKTNRSSIYQSECKDCGSAFFIPGDATQFETQHQRDLRTCYCHNCRQRKTHAEAKSGHFVWHASRKVSFSNRSLSEVGLGKLNDKINSPKKIDYQPAEDIDQKFQKIQVAVNELIKNLQDPSGSRVSIFVAPTGTGKTVWVTSQILQSEIGQMGKVLVTQPRTVTLRTSKNDDAEGTTPGFIAKEVIGAPGSGIGPGQEIGLLYRGESQRFDQHNKLLFLTDGILIKWLISGEIDQYSVIVIDEAHEQSENLELIFALLRYKMPLFPHLRVVIMSATVEPERFQAYFQPFGSGNPRKVPVFTPEDDRVDYLKTIHERWPDREGKYDNAANARSIRLPKNSHELPKSVADIVKVICTKRSFTNLGQQEGDILVFLPTIKLVELTQIEIEAIPQLSYPKVEVLPCHAQMTAKERKSFIESEKRAEIAFQKNKDSYPQRIILATNYAETSVTFTNLRFVVDSGYILRKVWNPETCIQEFLPEYHSQAGCIQRKGRIGRVQDGEVFKLYTKQQFEDDFRPTPLPDIATTNQDMFLLDAAAAGLNLHTFEWLHFYDDETHERQKAEKTRAIKNLKRINAIDEAGHITQLGFQIKQIEVENANLALFLVESDRFGCAVEAATFIAFIESSVSIFEDDVSGLLGWGLWRSDCYDDLEFYLRLFSYWEQQRNRLDSTASWYDKSKWSWLYRYGLRPYVYSQISQRRNALLKQLSSRMTATQRNKLDASKLNTVRKILARCFPEWAYTRNCEDPSSSALVPLDIEGCHCSQPVTISEESACFSREDISTVICVKRSQKKKSLSGYPIVRVEADWVPKLSQLNTMGFAMEVRKTTVELGSSSAEIPPFRNFTTPVTEISLEQYQKGQIRQFQLLRSQQLAKGRKKCNFLVRDVETQELVVAQFQEKGKNIEPGSTFRAYVEAIQEKGATLVVNQWQLYPEGTTIAPIKAVSASKNECIFILEPGLKGKLSKSELGESQQWLQKATNEGMALEVTGISKKKDIQLKPLPIVLEENRNYDGYVIDVLSAKEERRENGLLVEISPKVKGWVFQSEHSLPLLSAYKINDRINVCIQTKDANAQISADLVFKLSESEVKKGRQLELAAASLTQETDLTELEESAQTLPSNSINLDTPSARGNRFSPKIIVWSSVCFIAILALTLYWFRHRDSHVPDNLDSRNSWEELSSRL